MFLLALGTDFGCVGTVFVVVVRDDQGVGDVDVSALVVGVEVCWWWCGDRWILNC